MTDGNVINLGAFANNRHRDEDREWLTKQGLPEVAVSSVLDGFAAVQALRHPNVYRMQIRSMPHNGTVNLGFYDGSPAGFTLGWTTAPNFVVSALLCTALRRKPKTEQDLHAIDDELNEYLTRRWGKDGQTIPTVAGLGKAVLAELISRSSDLFIADHANGNRAFIGVVLSDPHTYEFFALEFEDSALGEQPA